MNVPALVTAHQLRQREYLLRITRAMTSRLDLPSLLRLILASAAEMVRCPAGMIVLREDPTLLGRPIHPPENQARFQVRAIYGIPAKLLPAFQPLLEDIHLTSPDVATDFDEVAIGPSGELYIRDLQARVRQVEQRLGVQLGSVIALPLLFEDELLGVIYLFGGDTSFSQLDWEFLQGFADQAAIAVRNARLYQQLAQERSVLATIIEHTADGIMILDPDRRVQVINQAMAALIGMAPYEAVGKACHQILPLQNVEGTNLCQEDAPLEPGSDQSFRCEGDLERPGGGHISLAVTFTPIFDENKQLVYIIVNVMDITRFREEEETKSTFVSIISHELKTPVAIIKGYAQTLARPDAEWDPETARQGLQIIEEEADRLESLIDTLLDVSRIQAGGLHLDIADVDLRRLLERLVRDYATQTDKHRIELDLPEDLPIISGDEERLRQVFTNLLNNALKYSPEGGVIRIGAWVEEKPQDGKTQRRVVIYVADQGVGIPESELPNIFDRFYRVDSSLRRSTAGAGLGLFLVRAIVEAHGGQIWVRSELGKGTTVFVALPLDDEMSS